MVHSKEMALGRAERGLREGAMSKGTTTALRITHEQLRAQVVELAKLLGWKCQWHWRSYHSPKGFPDLFIVRGERIVAAELKVKNDKVRPEQQEWLGILVATGKVETYVWRDTTPIEEIAEVLRSIDEVKEIEG